MVIIKKSLLDSIYYANPISSSNKIMTLYKKGYYSVSPIFYNNDNNCLLTHSHTYSGGDYYYMKGIKRIKNGSLKKE